MSSNKQKRQKLKLTRVEKKAELKRAELLASRTKAKAALLPSLKNGTIIAVDRSKIISRCAIPKIPDYYRDTWFTCKDCGEQELWTAKQQQRWYEEQGGEIEAVAVRCHSCRRKEKLRRVTARKVHLEGLARRRNVVA
jgi:predicted RNA-binding Zn-ribbon protein involved in translation (DUF1610 family)